MLKQALIELLSSRHWLYDVYYYQLLRLLWREARTILSEALADRVGKPISMADAQIAAITRSTKSLLATRNSKDFIQAAIEIFNPWGS